MEAGLGIAFGGSTFAQRWLVVDALVDRPLAKVPHPHFVGDIDRRAEAQEFMHFTVDGAARMKQLIEDLLAYSRVGTKGKELVPVSLEAPLKRALTNLRTAIDATPLCWR